MKGMFVDDSLSNLTSASNEASLSSSSNRNEIGTMYPPPQQQQQQQSFASVPINTSNQTQTNKKKRNLPGNPDPEAEVVALSPKSLMATNRFMCEICNKGFQRDQNLQLHRRGHNLPWKLKQRSKQEVVRKKVYVCPEASCVHHDPSRALGDLTGIKKHFSRKHGEKKWKCEKCSKRYAVQSDWKAHSKICGTREYRCDCGTLFSRRDSFITHRAFCDALAEESARSSSNHLPLHLPINFPLKTEPQHHLLQHPQLGFNIMQSTSSSSWMDHQQQQQQQQQQQNPSPNDHHNIHLPSPSPSPSPHMSATALLQKAAQMGVSMSKPAAAASTTAMSILSGPHQSLHDHMCAPTLLTCTPQPHHHHHGNLSSSDHSLLGLGGGFASVTTGCMDQIGATTTTTTNTSNNPHSQLLLQHNSLTSTSLGSTTAFEEAYNSMLSSSSRSKEGGNDELTRDFLGLRGFPPNSTDHHFLSMAGLDHLSNSSSSPFQHQQNADQNQNQIPWQG